MRLSAAKRLAELNSLPADVWQQLLPGLRDPAAGVRSQTAYEIGELGLNHEEVIDALIAILWHDEVKEVRRSAASALGKIGPVARRAMPALVAAIDEDSVSSTSTGWWVGLDAVGKVGGTDAIPVLMEYLTKPEMDLQLTAIRRLGDIGPAALEAVPAIDTFLDDEREWFRKAAALAISQITAKPPASTLDPAAPAR